MSCVGESTREQKVKAYYLHRSAARPAGATNGIEPATPGTTRVWASVARFPCFQEARGRLPMGIEPTLLGASRSLARSLALYSARVERPFYPCARDRSAGARRPRAAVVCRAVVRARRGALGRRVGAAAGRGWRLPSQFGRVTRGGVLVYRNRPPLRAECAPSDGPQLCRQNGWKQERCAATI